MGHTKKVVATTIQNIMTFAQGHVDASSLTVMSALHHAAQSFGRTVKTLEVSRKVPCRLDAFPEIPIYINVSRQSLQVAMVEAKQENNIRISEWFWTQKTLAFLKLEVEEIADQGPSYFKVSVFVAAY